MAGPRPDQPAGTETVPLRSRQSWLRGAVSLGLLALVLRQIDLDDLMGALRAATWGFVVLTLAGQFLDRFLAAYRWHVLLRSYDPRIRFDAVLRLNTRANFLALFLPGGGAEAVRVYGLNRISSNLSMALASVVLDRLLGLVVLLLFAVCGASFVTHGFAETRAVVWTSFGVVALCTVALFNRRARRWILVFLPRGLAHALQAKTRRIIAYLDHLEVRPLLLVWCVFLSVVNQVLRIAIVIVGCAAVGVEAPLAFYVAFVPLVVIAPILPLSIGGIGMREAAYIYFLGMIGVDAAVALAASLVVYGTSWIAALPGAFWTAPRRIADAPSPARAPAPQSGAMPLPPAPAAARSVIGSQVRCGAAVLVRAMEGHIIQWNEVAERTYGWSEVEAMGNVSHSLFKTEFPYSLDDINRELLETRRWEGTLVHTTNDGGRIQVRSKWELTDDARPLVVEVNRKLRKPGDGVSGLMFFYGIST